jgi:hypothetical protein
VNSLLDNTSFINDTILNTRKRKRKLQEVLTNQDSLLNLTVEESKTKSRTTKKNAKTPQSTRRIKSNKSPIIDESVLIDKHESSNAKTQKEKRQVSYSINNLINEDEDISEMVLRKKRKSDNNNSTRHKREFRTPEKSEKSLTNNVKTPEKEITPKSSPINVSLTPHRSTKTPKKSPINLGSPKTHAHDSFKLLNVQRKLSIINSPSSSENSNNSLQKLNVSNLGNSSLETTNNSEKNLTSVLKTSSTKKKSISSSFKVRPRFSKSPKIVLRTPKSKSAKSMKTSSSKKASMKKPSSVSPSNSKKVSKSNRSSKSNKTPITKQKLEKSLKSEESSESEKSLNSTTPLKSTKTPKSNSSSKSKKSVKATKSPKKVTQLKSMNSSNSILKKSKQSPIISPLNSKKMPKILLSTKKSSKSRSSSKKSVSPLKKSKSKKPIKSPKNDPQLKTMNVSVNLSTNHSIDKNFINYSAMSPKVVVNKLISPEMRNSIFTARQNQPTINLVPVDHVIKRAFNLENKKISVYDCKSLIAVKKYSDVVNINQDTPTEVLEKKVLNLKATNTSTPREQVKRTLSLDSDKKVSRRTNSSVMLNGSSTPKSKAIKRLRNESSVKIYQPLLEDESEPSLNESSLINMSDVFDSDNSQKDITFEINKSNLDKRKSLQDINVSQSSNKNNTFEIKKNISSVTKVKSIKDDTYELETSKIELQMKSNENIFNEEELSASEEPESKKSCKVHFANSGSEVQGNNRNTISRIGTPGHAMQQKKIPGSTNKVKTPINQSLVNKIENKKRVSSVSKLQVKTPVNTTKNKRLSNTLPDTTSKSRKSNHKAQIDSVNRLSRPKPIVNSEKKIGKTNYVIYIYNNL